MKKIKRVLQSFRYENLNAKIRYMLSLPLKERYAQGLGFAELMGLVRKHREYRDVRKSFSTVQVIKKK